ncbi:hypothetical protein HDK77DRAFT_485997 [Phyllosticta capitalensis]|uniref:Concanavalin A-like lectin/glucanase n=1 Tax=Phyllosticta capitalensis TaxID=121624 RepID=A0ABR1YQ22_9PEZI
MHRSILLSAAALALGAKAQDSSSYDGYEYGNMFYLGPTTGGQYITKATYSLVPPSPPTDYVTSKKDTTWLSLWIGIQADPTNENVLDMDFVQPLLNWAPDQEAQGCSADVNHWCVAASTYTPQGQNGQAYVAIPSDATLDFEVSVNSETNKIDQKVWINGELKSSQSDAQGMKPSVFYSGNECYDYGCGTLASYSWSNITLHMNEADAKYDTTMTLTNATSSGMTTSDGGKTWHIDSIKIAEDELTTQES